MAASDGETTPDGGPRRRADPFLVSDPEALRAFAHPLRQRILLELATLEHARAADLARVVDQPANAVSFHLRALAKAGLITEAPEHARDRRDRVWKPVAEAYALDRQVPGWTAVVDPMLEWVRRNVMDPVTDESVHRQLAASQLMLTLDEVRQLSQDLTDVIETWHDKVAGARRADPDQPRRTHYQVLFTVGPLDQPTL